LENLIERVIALTSNEYIQANELPFSLINISKMNGVKRIYPECKVLLCKAEEEFERGVIMTP